MLNPQSGRKFLQCFLIAKHPYLGGRNAEPNKLNKKLRQSNIKNSIFYEKPMQPIIGFFQVNFEFHSTHIALSSPHRLEEFLSHNNIIRGLMIRDKTTLTRINQLLNDTLKSTSQHLSHHLIQLHYINLQDENPSLC